MKNKLQPQWISNILWNLHTILILYFPSHSLTQKPFPIPIFKKIRDTKGAFHAKMGSIKDRNDMDITEAEDIKKRWQKYTEELLKKIQWPR